MSWQRTSAGCRDLERRVSRRLASVLALLWVGVVVVLSVVANARPEWIVTLAASPDRIREGKLWFLISSGMLVDRPVAISVICFVALAAMALFLCGSRVFWTCALLGQVAATLLVYVVVGAIRWTVPGALESTIGSPDFGVSAISAAWLGSIATVGWRQRGRSAVGRVWISATCLAVGLFAYRLRPDLSILSSEHLVAFALGVSAAIPGFWRRAVQAVLETPVARARSLLALVPGGNSTARMLAFLPALAAVAAVPSGLAALRHEIAIRLGPTATRCVGDWNTLKAAPRTLADPSVVAVSVTATRRPTANASAALRVPAARYCKYTFRSAARTTVVLGRWRDGRVAGWTATLSGRVAGPRSANASLLDNGRVRLISRHGHHLTLLG